MTTFEWSQEWPSYTGLTVFCIYFIYLSILFLFLLYPILYIFSFHCQQFVMLFSLNINLMLFSYKYYLIQDATFWFSYAI